MKTKTMTSFAAGLLVAAGVIGIVYFLEPKEVTSTTPEVEKPSVEEMKRTLVSEGYVIQTEEEWKKALAATEAAAEKKQENTKPEKTNQKEAEQVIYRTMLTVTEGMTSIDVGRALVKANIIDNALDFTQKVEKSGLAKKLRPGTYEVESNMTMDEVISIIFK